MNRILIFAFLPLAFNLLSQEPQSIKAFLGHEIGSQFSRHNEVVSYYEKLHLSFPERTKIQKQLGVKNFYVNLRKRTYRLEGKVGKL